MFKRFFIFSFLIFALLSCGTDYFYSSFYIRKEVDEWPLSPSEQMNLNHREDIVGNYEFNRYNSPSILATQANYILAFYENRTSYGGEIISVDGNKKVNVNVAISENAKTFSDKNLLVGNDDGSHGSPIAFVARNGNVVVLSVSGIGFGSGQADEVSEIAVSVSSNNGYVWTEWKNIETNTFEVLLKDKINRFYTNPGNGAVLGNGTLACIIDYKKNGANDAEGFAILYSTDNGETWQIGSTNKYTSSHRFARIITERKDGKLLIVASPNTRNDYNTSSALTWYLADSLNGNIKPFTVTGLPNNNGGTISADKIIFSENGRSVNGLILLHSYPNRVYINYNNTPITVKNATAISISKDEGASWTLVTNTIASWNENGKADTYAGLSTFRHAAKVLKDGTIVVAFEEGKGSEIINNSFQNFILAYRRFSLNYVSDGKYVYEGI